MEIAVWHNLPSGGAKRALYYHIEGLLKRGHAVEAWCPTTADQNYLPLSRFITEHIVPLDWKLSPSKNVLVAGLSDSVSKIKAMEQHCRRCAAEINRGGFDLLFANACMFFRAAPIGRFVDLPRAIYLQEPFRRLYEASPQFVWMGPPPPPSNWRKLPRYVRDFVVDALRIRKLRILAREEWLNACTFDVILVNSFYSRESILRAYGLDARVCYLGVDAKLFTHQHKPREEFVVGVGTFSPAKNIPFVLQSLSQVSKPIPRLVWIGNYADPAYLRELRDLAQSLGVDFESRVSVNDDELVDLLNRAAMMVYAPRLEPFGLAPLEANACGLPVIAVAEGGVRESIIGGVNGIIVEQDSKAMARAIENLRADPVFARRLGEQGHELVISKWSLDSAMDRLEQRFNETIAIARRRMA